MRPWEILGQARTPDGATMTLTRSGTEHVICVDGQHLMSSRMHGSEDTLASVGCARARSLPHPQVLVGGLGMGFTLRATLDLLPPEATVVLAEIMPAVVVWNQSLLGDRCSHPLADPRVAVEVGDVRTTLYANPGRFDAVLLDVDNGPSAFTSSENDRLYDAEGLAAARAALTSDGVLAVWSARDEPRFRRRLTEAGFRVDVARARGHARKGPRHVIFVGYNQDR